GKSISATHAGSTSAGYSLHLALVRRLSASRSSPVSAGSRAIAVRADPELGREQLVAAQPVGEVVRVGHQDQLVGAGERAQLLESVADLDRGAGDRLVGGSGRLARPSPLLGKRLLDARKRARGTGPQAAEGDPGGGGDPPRLLVV